MLILLWYQVVQLLQLYYSWYSNSFATKSLAAGLPSTAVVWSLPEPNNKITAV